MFIKIQKTRINTDFIIKYGRSPITEDCNNSLWIMVTWLSESLKFNFNSCRELEKTLLKLDRILSVENID